MPPENELDLDSGDEETEIDIEDQDDTGDEAGEGEGEADHGQDDTDGEDEGQEDGRSEAQDSSVKKPSRRDARIETALREAKEAKEELARLRAERTTGRTAEEQTRAQALEQERLANMDPEERFEYRLQQERQRNDARYAQLEFKNADSADRTHFEGLCARNPVASRLSTQVEDYLAEMRRNGTNAPRETVLKYVIGERALANAGKAKGRAQRQADTNRTNQTVRPGAARGDTSGEVRRGGDTREARAKRLENMPI